MTGSTEDESIDTQQGVETRSRGPVVSRREVLRTVGVTAGAAAVGVGSTQLDPVSPVGDSEALAFTTAAALTLAGAGAGVALAKWQAQTDDPDTNASEAMEDQLYNAALTVAEGRKAFEREMKANYVDSPTGESAYADTAWSEIRAAAATETVNGGTATDAEQAAAAALEKQTRISVNNIVERWNTGVLALQAHVTQSSKDGLDMFNNNNGNFVPGNAVQSGWSLSSGGHPHADSSTYYTLAETSLSLPGSPSDVDGIDSEPTLYGFTIQTGDDRTLAPQIGSNSSNSTDWGGATPAKRQLGVTHSSLSDKIILDADLYSKVLEKIHTEYDNISNDLSTYVNNLHSALNQGAIDAADIISPTDLVDQFASDEKRERLVAELAAIGANVPENVGWKATISHPDLSANTLDVDLFLRFSGDAVPIQSDMVLSSSDYRAAYIGYESQATGEYVTEVLSGSSDLTISNVTGISGSTDATSSAPSSAAGDGSVNFGSDPPEEIKNPSSFDDSYIIELVTGSSGTFTAPVSDVVEQSGDYVLPSSASPLSGGETLDTVNVVPVVDTIKTTEYVADPTTVDSASVKSIIESQKALADKIDKLDEAANDGGGGGGLFGSGLPSLPGLSTAESAAVVIVATLGLSALN